MLNTNLLEKAPWKGRNYKNPEDSSGSSSSSCSELNDLIEV